MPVKRRDFDISKNKTLFNMNEKAIFEESKRRELIDKNRRNKDYLIKTATINNVSHDFDNTPESLI